MNSSDPDWQRMPLGRAKALGFSRSSIYRAIKAGSVRGKSYVKPGSKTGMSFFSLTDLQSLIDSAPDLGQMYPLGKGFSLSNRLYAISWLAFGFDFRVAAIRGMMTRRPL